jgi:hypothetical protein
VAAGTGNLFLAHCGCSTDFVELFPVLQNIARAFANFIAEFTRHKKTILMHTFYVTML